MKLVFDFSPNTNNGSKNKQNRDEATLSLNNVQESKTSLSTKTETLINNQEQDIIEVYTKILHKDFSDNLAKGLKILTYRQMFAKWLLYPSEEDEDIFE
ncbi:unnamed protein product [Brachionus calyciflorus]|uniref:Uncharacterized protein n=1 Tax=Brachionus calyciflorus TaxID=104777 RepID=A0A814GSY4_9BILA|nr:unnamed protein product [Brachionus calyciflorus]